MIIESKEDEKAELDESRGKTAIQQDAQAHGDTSGAAAPQKSILK